MTKPHVIRKRLLAHYESATKPDKQAGVTWYDDARKTARALAKEAKCSLSVAAGVIAALSPRVMWSVNVRWARLALISGIANRGFKHSRAKAQAILQGGKPLTVLKGPKVRAFYRAIMGDNNAAVVDVWIAHAASVDSSGWTDKQYNVVAKAMVEAAFSVGVPTAHFQATVWITVRGRAQ